MAEGYENRLVLDEDVAPSLAESLRQRGFDAVALNELRELIYERSGREGGSIGDDEVCDEVARVPSILITLNVRDYADLAGLEQLVLARGVSVAMVRVPKRESRAGQRAKAIAEPPLHPASNTDLAGKGGGSRSYTPLLLSVVSPGRGFQGLP